MDRVVKIKNKKRKYVVFTIKVKSLQKAKINYSNLSWDVVEKGISKKYQNKHLKFRSFTEIVCEN